VKRQGKCLCLESEKRASTKAPVMTGQPFVFFLTQKQNGEVMTVHVRYTLAFLLSIFLVTGVCEGQDKGYKLDEDGMVNVYTSEDVLSIPFGVETAVISIGKGEAVVSSVKTYEDGKRFKNGEKRKIEINEVKINKEMSKILADYKTKKIIRDNEPPYENPEKGKVDQSKSFLIVIDNPDSSKEAADEIRKMDGIRHVHPVTDDVELNIGPAKNKPVRIEVTPNDTEGNPNDPFLPDQWNLLRNNKYGLEIQWAWDYLDGVGFVSNDTKIAVVEATKGDDEEFDNVKNIENSELQTNIKI